MDLSWKKINSQLYFMNSAPQGKPTPYFYHNCFKATMKKKFWPYLVCINRFEAGGKFLWSNLWRMRNWIVFHVPCNLSYVSRNSREFCLIAFFQSSFTPWNHMLANISTFLQLSLQYCCTALHLPFTLMYTLTTFHHSYLYQSKYVVHILST